MGHTTLPITQRFRNERAFFSGFRRALLTRKDELLFDELWDTVENYIPPAEKSTHPLLIATILMSMILEQRKLIDGLQTQVEMLNHELEAAKKSKDEETARLKRDMEWLENELDERVEAMKKDIFETISPPYAS